MASFAQLPGGVEFNLITCMDAKIWLVVATVEDVEDTTVHVFIHVTKELQNIQKPHVGALVDNREKSPVYLIQNFDGEDQFTARRVFINFFSNGHAKVRITNMYVLTKVHLIHS